MVDARDLAHSQKLPAHKHREMTEHYAKARTGGSASDHYVSVDCWLPGESNAENKELLSIDQ